MLNACMIVHSYYPDDPRVRRETEALLGDGWKVDVICLRGKDEKATEECGGATVYRIPIRRHRSGLSVYLMEYLSFFLAASARVTGLHLRRRYDVIQAHNMPDFLVFTGLLPKLFGARVVLDIHDLVPELYSVKFGVESSHLLGKIVRWAERRSTGFADHVITAGQPFRRRLITRQVPPEKVTVVMNSADPGLFRPVQAREVESIECERFTLMYHGGIFHRYGLDIAIKAVNQLRDKVPGLRFQIYGDGDAVPDLRRLIRDLALEDKVQLGGFVPIDRIPSLIAQADLGVVPYRQNPFTDLLFPTKAFEYIVMGVPVVMARTGAVADLFTEIPDLFVRPESVDDLASRILTLYRDPQRRHQLLNVSEAAYLPYSWNSQREQYLNLMHQLVKTRLPVLSPQYH
ncbi:MAG TPA: glycosyltransferase family 4 protein [Chloroflexota bacterium]|nr:glycosyltransferase family 4 protein [Chloroflexota bacterium]